MNITRKKFVITFVIAAFAFQMISNSVLGTSIQLFPSNGDWYTGLDSPIAWKNTVATIIYPIKYILIEPLSFLGQDPDPAPPVLLLAFGLYWTVLALVLYIVYNSVLKMKKS